MTGGRITLCEEILGATRTRFSKAGSDWTEEQAIRLLNGLVRWWDADKNYLKKDTTGDLLGSIADEFRARFQHIVSIVTDVVAPRLSLNAAADAKATLYRLLSELEDFGLPCLMAHAASCHIFPECKAKVYSGIEDAVSTTDQSKIDDALNAVLVLLYPLDANAPSGEENSGVLNSVGQQIKWRREVGLVSSLRVVVTIVKNNRKHLDDRLLSDVLIGLKYLCSETDIAYAGINTDIAEKLIYRKFAARLAYVLFTQLYSKGERVPKVIDDWKSICISWSEFAEIRNEWMDA